MSDSKQQILAALRKNLPQASELPSLQQEWIRFDDLPAQFATVLASVGGLAQRVGSPEEAQKAISEVKQTLSPQKICSMFPDLEAGNTTLSPETDPHLLEDVDLAILKGRFGVAENGAVWVEGEDLVQRTILFIAQHVILIVPEQEIVHNMHEAYPRINFSGASFGLFVSGPSKTADIEQSLVIGAHGARSLTVLLTRF